MMDMQEVTERRRLKDDYDEERKEVDPSVNGSPEAEMAAARKRRSGGSWLRYVTDRVWPTIFLTVATFGLHEAKFVQELLYSHVANRTFVNLGIFFSTSVMLFASYIEVYRSMLLGDHVRYENAKTSTHGMLVSMIAASICFTIGLWPVWGWLTMPYLFMWFWGVIVQLVVIFPVQLQRIIFAGAYLWFMHSYLSLFVV
ncbi:TPA: hypothetical protein N0F65_004339 [Lagenidium giganteum]|uniref:Uncharacterized protein n=1 Tax=Lagenidium giganteum TaxID=4803 RepID=A0AAV2YNA2_9STRA|nr:TPA: hypothetical protein N0F65_004339 [Lagenidium giganteum]